MKTAPSTAGVRPGVALDRPVRDRPPRHGRGPPWKFFDPGGHEHGERNANPHQLAIASAPAMTGGVSQPGAKPPGRRRRTVSPAGHGVGRYAVVPRSFASAGCARSSLRIRSSGGQPRWPKSNRRLVSWLVGQHRERTTGRFRPRRRRNRVIKTPRRQQLIVEKRVRSYGTARPATVLSAVPVNRFAGGPN